METLKLEQAAEFQMHLVTVQVKARSGERPVAELGNSFAQDSGQETL
jgi:hypothetical protein